MSFKKSIQRLLLLFSTESEKYLLCLVAICAILQAVIRLSLKTFYENQDQGSPPDIWRWEVCGGRCWRLLLLWGHGEGHDEPEAWQSLGQDGGGRLNSEWSSNLRHWDMCRLLQPCSQTGLWRHFYMVYPFIHGLFNSNCFAVMYACLNLKLLN